MLNLDSEAQVYGSTFTFCYGHLKKVILLVKVATVQSVLLLAVYEIDNFNLKKAGV